MNIERCFIHNYRLYTKEKELSIAKKKIVRSGRENIPAKKDNAVRKSAEKTADTSAKKPGYPELFQPIKIGDWEIKTRIVMGPKS